MASKLPSSSSGISVKHLIVDSSPLLTSPLASLRGIATNYLVTPDVVMELRDKNGRNVLEEANLQLPADTTTTTDQDNDADDDEMKRKHEGFQVREPTAEAIAKSKLTPPPPLSLIFPFTISQTHGLFVISHFIREENWRYRSIISSGYSSIGSMFNVGTRREWYLEG